MIGVESRKLKRAAASRVKLRNRPPVMVMPERDTPGMTAKACKTPTVIASVSVIFERGLVNRLLRSASHMMTATTISMIATSSGARKVVSMRFSSSRASDCRGNGCGDHVPEQAAFALLFCGSEITPDVAGFGEANDLASECGAQDLDPRPPEINEDGEQRSGMQRHIEREAGIAPVGQSESGDQPWHQCEMCGAGDGEKFCETLNDSEDDRFDDWQPIPPYSQMWAYCSATCITNAALALTSRDCPGIA